MSYTSGGVRLFQNDGDFIRKALSVMCQYGVLQWQHNPFSDVKAIRARFQRCCLNISAGYYNWHRRDEFVKPSDVEHALAFGSDLLHALGERRYDFDSSVPDLAAPVAVVTDRDLDMTMNAPDWKFGTPFDPVNPDPWLESLIQHPSDMPLAGQRASVFVLRAVLEGDAYVRSTGQLPADAPPGEWLPWRVQRGRVDDAEMGAPSVLLAGIRQFVFGSRYGNGGSNDKCTNIAGSDPEQRSIPNSGEPDKLGLLGVT